MTFDEQKYIEILLEIYNDLSLLSIKLHLRKMMIQKQLGIMSWHVIVSCHKGMSKSNSNPAVVFSYDLKLICHVMMQSYLGIITSRLRPCLHQTSFK